MGVSHQIRIEFENSNIADLEGVSRKYIEEKKYEIKFYSPVIEQEKSVLLLHEVSLIQISDCYFEIDPLFFLFIKKIIPISIINSIIFDTLSVFSLYKKYFISIEKVSI